MMIIIDSRVPFEIIDMVALEKLVDPQWTLKMSMVHNKTYADGQAVMANDYLHIDLTTNHIDFALCITRELSMYECVFDLVIPTVQTMVDALKIKQRLAWEYLAKGGG